MRWYRTYKTRVAVLLMVVIVVGVAASTPGQHLWLWPFLLLAYVGWHVDRKRRTALAGHPGPSEVRKGAHRRD